MHNSYLTVPLQIGSVRADVHQVGNALAAAAFSYAFKQLTDLKEQHYEDCFRELGGGLRQEPYAQRAEGRNAHQKVLVEGLAVSDALSRLLQSVESRNQIRNQINQKQLPGGQAGLFLNYYGCNQQQ